MFVIGATIDGEDLGGIRNPMWSSLGLHPVTMSFLFVIGRIFHVALSGFRGGQRHAMEPILPR